MLKIKHSKFKNTGLLFSLLTKQLTSDILKEQDSPCVKLIGKHFKGNSALAKEYKLYENIANCLLYTSPSPRDGLLSRMPSSA